MLRAFRSILLFLVAVSLGSVDLWGRPVSCVSGTADMLVVRERPDALKQEIFKILFDSAELSKFTPDERARYQLDMTTERDIHNQIVYARDKGLEEGLAKGREEGRQEGVAEGLRLVAEQMRKAGITEEDVQRILNDVRGMT